MNISRIILSLLLIVAASASLVGSTGAFFSDTEISNGNTFVAGDIDLTIDNESYYNGVASPETSWLATDLTIEKFFNFLDLKPDDWGEDTVSVHVNTNDAYLCANITLTSNDDRTCNEPEMIDDPSCAEPDADLADGELADLVEFMWWADDGDNVLEVGENVISSGPIGVLTLDEPFNIALADSDQNIWTNVAGPVTGDTTYYIGKAWCFGAIASAALPAAAYSGPDDPANHDDGAGNATASPEDGGISCIGNAINNAAQTDGLTADVTFEAVQARNNPTFQCAVSVPDPVDPPIELVDDDFGTGDCIQNIPGWDEDTGESCVNGTVAAAVGTGDDTASPDGGRFALIGNLGYICRQIDATGLENLQLKYYWRGDSAADPGDTGGVHYFTGGTCASPTGQVSLTSHDLTSTSWSALQSVNLPASLNNSTFFIRYTSDTNAGTESFRVDGVNVTGTSI